MTSAANETAMKTLAKEYLNNEKLMSFAKGLAKEQLAKDLAQKFNTEFTNAEIDSLLAQDSTAKKRFNQYLSLTLAEVFAARVEALAA